MNPMFSGGLSARRGPAVKVPVLAVRCIRYLPLVVSWIWRTHVDAGIPPVVRFRTCRRRWMLVRRGHATVGSSACVETTGGCGWALPQPAASRMRIPQEWFADSPSCCAPSAISYKCLICQVCCPRLSRYGGSGTGGPPVFAVTVAGNGAGGSQSQGKVEVVLSSPATEGGASPSRPDERARLEPRAPCYRRGAITRPR